MNKKEFTSQIYSRLKGIPEADINRSLDYYTEMIDDRIEDGLTEDEAVAALGSIEEIALQIQAEHPASQIASEFVKQGRKLRAWQIVLLILGSPVWLPLLLAAAIIVLAVYIVLWSVIIVLYAADLTLAAGAICGLAGAASFFFRGHFVQGVLFIGAGLVCGGLAVLFFFVCNLAAKGIIILTKKTAIGIKRIFTGKENV